MLKKENLCHLVASGVVLLGLFWPCGAYTSQQPSTGHFLAKIAILESNNGQNTNHKKMEKGIHRGDSAQGIYGLMPNTIKEIINRGKFSKDCENLKNIKKCEYIWAYFLADKLLKRLQNPAMCAYAWFYGHNLSKKEIIRRKYKKSFYVKRFNKL